MRCLLAGTFDSSGVGGIVFDAAAAYGGFGASLRTVRVVPHSVIFHGLTT
jgi:hypothetical protein